MIRHEEAKSIPLVNEQVVKDTNQYQAVVTGTRERRTQKASGFNKWKMGARFEIFWVKIWRTRVEFQGSLRK